MAEDWKGQRQWELENKAERTTEEQQELGQLQAEEWRRLETREDAAKKAGDPSPLMEEETTKLREYEARDTAAEQLQIDALVANGVLKSPTRAADAEEQRQQDESATTQAHAVAPSSGGEGEVKESEHTWYGDVRSWLSDKLSIDLPGNGDQDFMPWVGSEAFVQLGVDQKIDEGAWQGYSPEERDTYIRSKAQEYRDQQSLAVGMNIATEIPGSIARKVGEWVSEGLSVGGARDAVAKDTGQFVTDVGEWIGFGAAAAIIKEMSLVGKVAEGMPLKVFRKSERIVLEDGSTQVVKKISKVEYCQVHHILSDKNRFIQGHKLLEKAGFDLNDPMNKMMLPTVKGAERSTTFRSIHQGRHVEDYSRDLGKKMTDAHDLGVIQRWDKTRFRQELEKLISTTKKELKQGEIKLNRRTRESEGLPTKGGQHE